MTENRPYLSDFAARIEGKNFVGGEWINAGDGTIDVLDPSRDEVIGRVARSTAEDVDRAVRAAREAQAEWGALTYASRSAILLELANVLEEHSEEISLIEAVDAGKPISAVRDGEVLEMVDAIRFYAGIARTLPAPAGGDFIDGISSTMRREPLGVAVGITPWNYPLMQAIKKILPAIATGNTFVVKPAETTPYSTARFVELAGAVLPPGVVNIVFGTGAVAGDALTRHDEVDVISFTGSIATGRRIGAIAGERLRKVVLELGGNAPVLVFGDADVRRAARIIVDGGLYNTGQECMAASRVIAHSSIVDELIAEMREHARTFALGDVLDERTTLAPMNSKAHLERVLRKLDAASRTATVEKIGETPDGPGYFLGPVLVTGAANDDPIVSEEIFGPVFTIQTFETEDEALALANSTNYGLSASVFTRDVGTATRVQNGIVSGTVWVNTHLVFAEDIPVTGFADSGLGTENAQGGLLEYTQIKHVMVDTRS